MIKIPKSLTELKSMLSDANFGEALTKVQATMNSASTAVQAAVIPRVEGELGQVVEQLRILHEQESVLLKRLTELTVLFQQDLNILKEAMAHKPSEPEKEFTTDDVPVINAKTTIAETMVNTVLESEASVVSSQDHVVAS